MSTYTFKTNINCGNCIKSITPILNELDNIELWKVDTENPNKVLTVTIDDEDFNSIENAIKSAGFKIERLD
ncbi:MAG: heavy-metal-associated domain-containing protein [Crocinitomicaceae bacterium]|nr:heavy-metal-associated domain-containing protein [Crocinitomicaceae bacterium]